MPIQNASDSQKVDFLWKKIVYGAAKTDIAGNIDATQEPYASPLQIRGDRIMQQSNQIPAIIPGANSSVVSVYTTSLPIECTSASGIPTPTLTWITGVTNWIPPEFGSTYQVKVYISPSGQAGNVLTKGTQVFATGSGSNDLWVFDYQAGILNFNSNNTPYSGGSPISFTGNSVYISGAVYSGLFGLPDSANIANVILGNITFTGNTISSNQTNGNIMISAPGTGIVQFVGQDAIGLPAGNIVTRPSSPYTGYIRFNTEISDIEYWDGTMWTTPAAGVISSDTINPDGVANVFVLSSNSSTLGVMVSINGTLQQPYTSYTIINNNQIQFTEIPLTTDIIEVRHIVPGTQTVSAESLTLGTTKVELDASNVNVTGNFLPSANVTYDIGSSTLRWRTGYFSANTIDIGGGTIGLHDVLGFTFTTPGGEPQYMMPNGASTSNTFTSSTVTIQGNLAVSGNITTIGNVSGQYILGSAQFLTGLPVGYSNVNTKAYTESMGFANYSNVNVKAYTESMGFANYSNVNVAAYTQTQSYTNYSNVNLSAYLGGAVTIGGNLTVNGNLFVNGNLTTINANNLNISDSLIFLADFNPADTLDIGVVSSFTSAVRYQHTGFVRDATDGTWKLFANVVPEPTTTVDFTNATYSNLQIGNLTAIGSTFNGNVNISGNVSANSYIGGGVNVTGNVLANTVSATRGNLGSLTVTGNITATGSIIQNGITGGIIPIGGIIMWSGNVATIPTNWAFCDGLNGTPDLRNQFIIGAAADSSGQANTTVTGSTTKIGGTANAIVVSHTHTATVTDPGHFHATRGTRQVQAGADNSGPLVTESDWGTGSNQYQTSPKSTGITVGISTDGSSATNANLPPYYALAFIMRIS